MIRIGTGTCLITNKLGTHIQGATVGGTARYVRDELEANAWYMSDAGMQILLISCDLGGLEPDRTAVMVGAISERTGLAAQDIVIGATHTGGPSVIPTNYHKPVDQAYLDWLQAQLVELADRTLGSAVPARVAVCEGATAIGHNRRSCYADGQHHMQGGQTDAAFTGLEGPSDPAQLAVFALGEDGELRGILHQNTCHPCSFYGADFYSADFPGYARRILRDATTPDLPVLFFNGAFGDQGQDRKAEPRFAETRERRYIRCGSQLAAETLRLLQAADFRADHRFATAYTELAATVQLPSAADLQAARTLLAQVDAGAEPPAFELLRAHGQVLLQARFGEAPRESLPLHVWRLGPVAVVTQGTELFCQFGLDIKRRSPFPITAVWSICDGYRGYCPTYDAVVSGGYSADPIYWTRFTPDTGYRLVDAASALLHALSTETPDHA